MMPRVSGSLPATRLLVSVVSADEVAAALEGGSDVVDVKNPAEGSLGAPVPSLLRDVRSRVGRPLLVSAALGDAPHLPGTLALAAAGAAACDVDYVKVGLLGSSRPEQALDLLAAVCQAATEANARVRIVAVAYADAARVGGLPPGALPAVAHRAGAHGAMLDTAVKDGTSTFLALGPEGVAHFLAEARALGLMTALAGALGPDDLARAGGMGVDLVGVRGAACDGGRNGRVSATRVRALRDVLGLRAPASLASARP
jgi:uncharacterized protein (UPF0264 family)